MLTKNDLSEIRGVVQEETRKIVQEEIAPLKKSLTKIEKKLDKTIDYFDSKFLNHENRLKSIETHLDLSPAIN